MKPWALMAIGGAGGLLARLVLLVAVVTVGPALGLDDTHVGAGRPSLSGAFGLLILVVSVIGGALLGYKIGVPRPHPTELRQSRDYFQWIQNYQETETSRSSSSKEDRGDGEGR